MTAYCHYPDVLPFNIDTPLTFRQLGYAHTTCYQLLKTMGPVQRRVLQWAMSTPWLDRKAAEVWPNQVAAAGVDTWLRFRNLYDASDKMKHYAETKGAIESSAQAIAASGSKHVPNDDCRLLVRAGLEASRAGGYLNAVMGDGRTLTLYELHRLISWLASGESLKLYLSVD